MREDEVHTSKQNQFAKPNLTAGKHEYAELKEELTRQSRISAVALEEGQASTQEFNLDEFLHGLRQAQDSAGHISKNLGVIWKNLTVKVIKKNHLKYL
jgi:hypothetical protein